MRSARFLLVFFLLCSFVTLASGDQVTLKNGDRLTGMILKSDSKSLSMKTDFAGDVTIDWSAVQQITSSVPLHVSLSSGQTLVGAVTTEDGNFKVNTASRGEVPVSKDQVQNLRNDSEQAAYERTLHPGLLQEWNGGVNLGFALTRGNSRTKNLSLAFTAQRKTLNDQIATYMNSVYATNDAPGAVPGTTANAIQGGIRYDRNFDTRLFGFVSGDFQMDALQSLNLRSVLSSGLGLHAINSDRTTLDLLAGGNYTRENYTTLNRNIAAVTLGEDLSRKVGLSTLITEHLYFYPNISDAGDYRATFNFGTVTKMSKWLGWQNSFGDIYVSNPPLGKKQNDIQLTTGLNISFNH
jgi:putative salt-induced outer membrane protein YdiY